MPFENKEMCETLVTTDKDLKRLSDEHRELDLQVKKLEKRRYQSQSDRLETLRLKKLKLKVKDEMDRMARVRTVPAGRS